VGKIRDFRLKSPFFEINGDFSRKSQFFPTPVYFAPPWNWLSALWVKNLNDGATGPRKKFDDIFSCLDTIQERYRDGRTDGHRATAKTALRCAVKRSVHFGVHQHYKTTQ